MFVALCLLLSVCCSVADFMEGWILWSDVQGVGVTLVLLLTGTSRWYRCLLFLPYAIAVTLLWMGAKGQ